MKHIVSMLAMMIFTGCAPDQTMLMETKFDSPLRQKMSDLVRTEQSEILAILGKCNTTIDGVMRKQLIDAGATVETLAGNTFTARVSSDDVFSVAALDFVEQVHLSGTSKLLGD